MTDSKRSALMSRMGTRNTGPEIHLQQALLTDGLEFDLHDENLAGRPDVVFSKQRVVVFIDGCFWHGCPEHYVRPRSREDFWSAKLRNNVERDRRQTLELEAQGWKVCRFWEHEVYECQKAVVAEITVALQTDRPWQAPRSWRVVKVLALNEDGSQERRILEPLRSSEPQRAIDQERHTRKWKRPKPSK